MSQASANAFQPGWQSETLSQQQQQQQQQIERKADSWYCQISNLKAKAFNTMLINKLGL